MPIRECYPFGLFESYEYCRRVQHHTVSRFCSQSPPFSRMVIRLAVWTNKTHFHAVRFNKCKEFAWINIMAAHNFIEFFALGTEKIWMISHVVLGCRNLETSRMWDGLVSRIPVKVIEGSFFFVHLFCNMGPNSKFVK